MDEEKQLLDNSVEFMEKCEKGILIDKDSCKFIDSPKISVIIPVYSASATIKKAIRSIQNQTLKEIEIILYDDASPDNSFNIMKELQEEDPRIKLYKNENNRGVFYTRLSASKTAKGKYIMYLDNDDMFSRIDILNIVYGEIEKTGHDIIEFNGYSTHDYHLINKDKNIKSTSIYNKETEFTQPELSRVRIKKINENLVENYNTIDSIIQNEKKIKEKEKDKAEDIDKEIKEWEKIKEKQLKFDNSLQELKAQEIALEKNFNK